MGYYGSPQHQRDQDARAIIRMGRKLVAEVDELRYHVTENARYR